MAVKRNEKARNQAFVTLLFIVVLGLVFAFGFYVYAKTLKTEIYVFNDGYRAGTVVSADMFSPLEIDNKLVNLMNEQSGYASYSSMEELNEKIRRAERLKTDVVPGLPATSNLFSDSFSGTVESHLSDNLVSVELYAGKVSGLSGREIYTGTRVNLLASAKSGADYTTEVLFQDVPVVSVTEDGNGRTESIFVELQPDESLKLVNALYTKDLTVSIIKQGSYLPLKEGELSFSERAALAGNSGKGQAPVAGNTTEETQ